MIHKTERNVGKHLFTLIELLIVVAIIAILASMLLPALARAREHAKTVKCGSNLKQIHMALILYVDDHDGWCPPTMGKDYAWGGSGSRNHWADFLVALGYVDIPMKGISIPGWMPVSTKNPGVFQCPSWRNYILEPNLTQQEGYGPTLTFEWNLFNVLGRPRKLSRIGDNKAMMTEGNTFRIQPDHPYNSWDAVLFRHSNKAQFMYVGGHVELHQAHEHEQ